MTNGGATAHLPLRGLRVLDLGDFIAAPYCARLLADAGADVLKVEPPGGDSARRAGPFPGDRPDPDGGALNAFVNRGKRSVTLDTATDAGRRTLGNLIERADVLVHDFASPAASPLGLDADAMLARYPRLVTASITPFGESGPYRDLRADDLVTMAMSGLAFATPGFPDYAVDPETEPPLRPNAYVAEFVGGLMGAVGATMALINRLTTGLGDYVEVSKQEAVACMLSWDQAMYSYGGNVVGRRQSSAGLGPNNYLPCADGWMVIVAFMDNHWR
ncbi:MAG: CoA transferase, partial [Dehalococcoidia bacterium]